MIPHWRSVRPGWFLLAAVLLYAVVVTVMLVRSREVAGEYRTALAQVRAEAVPAPAPRAVEEGLWFPLPGARLPDNPSHLPGSARAYRQGVNQGFDFYDGGAGIPVPYGAPVIAAASGTIVRVDNVYREPDEAEWQALMESVADGAEESELDRLRGRQIWLETDDGRLLRYAHLSAVREGLDQGRRVVRGQVLGYVGNSGTDEGVAGTERGARLHFEVWEGDSFFGEGMDGDELRIAAASLFTGP